MQAKIQVKRRDHGVITQMFRKSRAKELEIFRNCGAPRSAKLRELGHHALKQPEKVVAIIYRV